MNLRGRKLTVHEYADRAVRQVRNKIILVGGFLIIPSVTFLTFYFEYSSLSQALIPVTKQMGQAVSLGDEFALQRITDSLSLIPQISVIRVYLEDGTCAAESKSQESKETWSSLFMSISQKTLQKEMEYKI